MVIITLILLLTMCSCGSDNTNITMNEESGGINIISELNTYDLFDAVTNGNNIYIADKEHILITDRNGSKKSEIKGLQFCTKLAISSDSLYALDRGNNSDVIKEYSLKGSPKQEIPISTSNVEKFEYLNNNLIFHQYDTTSNKRYLSILNLNTKNMTSINHRDLENIDVFSVYKDNTLIAGVSRGTSQNRFIIYDYEKGEIIEEIKNNLYCSDLTYDKNDNCLYCTADCKIYRYDIKNNETEKLIDLSSYTGFVFYKIISNTDSFYLLDTKDDRIFHISKDTAATKSKDTLTIISRISIDSEFNKAEELFKKANPECDIIYRTKSLDDLKISIMAGDKDIDIIYVENYLFNDFVRSGAVITLDEYQNIKENFANMFYGIESLCTYNNKLVGVPMYVDIFAWEANQELLDKLNLELPDENWDWYDFYEYAKIARRDINGDGIKDTYIFEGQARYPAFLQQYNCAYVDLAAGTASFNNDEFKNLLLLWKKMWNEDLIASGSIMNTKMKDNIFFSMKRCSLALGDKAIVYPPTLLDGQKLYSAQIYLLCINSQSKNKDLAAEFLSVYCSKEVQTSTVPADRAFYKDINLYPSIPEKYGRISNKNNIEIFKSMFRYSKREQDHVDLRDFMLKIISDYMSDKISLDNTVTLIDDKAKMIIGE